MRATEGNHLLDLKPGEIRLPKDVEVGPLAQEERMTDKQIEEILRHLREDLEAHRSEFFRDAVERTLSIHEYRPKMFKVFRDSVGSVSDIIIREVPVNRSRTPEGAIFSLHISNQIDYSVIDSVPLGKSSKVRVIFFELKGYGLPPGHFINDEDLEGELKSRGLRSADLHEAAAVPENDPSFLDFHRYGIHWKGPDGEWCHGSFGWWSIRERGVCVGRGNPRGWNDCRCLPRVTVHLGSVFASADTEPFFPQYTGLRDP